MGAGLRLELLQRTPDRARARCYRVSDLLRLLNMSRATFFRLRRQGELPMLEELTPRLGRIVRYRADRVDGWLANAHVATLRPRPARGPINSVVRAR